MKTSKSIIRIIDKYFDKYKGICTPYEIETNATLLSFFKKTYALLKTDNIFNDEKLVNTYISCCKEVIKIIRFIENSKVYKFKFTLDSNKANPKAYAFLDCVENLSNRYTNRNYDKKLLEEEQKIGYNHYYNENIYLSKGLIPSYNEDEEGSVEFKLDDNPNLIKICLDGSFIIWQNQVAKKYSNFQSFKEQIITMDKNDSLLDFYQTVRQAKDAEKNTEYFVTFAFEDGFTVNANNEYEQNNGLLLELFQYVQKSFEEKANILEKYLKQYFYNTLLEKYRTKQIIDKETNIKTTDISATNNFIAFPKVYENLMGKAGKIGSSNTINYDINNFKYIKLPFDKSILNTDGKIYFYVNKKFLSNNLNLLKKYKKIDFEIDDESFLYNIYNKNLNTNQVCNSKYTTYFDNINDDGDIGRTEFGKNSNKQAAKYIKQYGNQLKEEILKQNFFAVTPKFIPDTNDYFTTYYFQNVKKIEKEFFYNENYSSSILDLSFDKSYMILSLQTELYPEKNVSFGSGVLNTRKTQQKFYDNVVSTLSQSETTSKDSNFKSKEFSSLFDDREITVIATSDTIVTAGQNGYTNVRYDETGSYFVETNFPKYKNSILYSKENELWLDCSNFSEYNDINSIKQIRIVLMRDNTKRLLFNVDRVETEYIPTKISLLELDIKNPKDFNISYVIDNGFIIASSANSSNTNIENEVINISSNSYEDVKITKFENEDYSFNFMPVKDIPENYLFDDEIVFNKKSITLKKIEDGENENYILVADGNKKEKTEYEVNKFLVLKNNLYTSKINFAQKEDCQILDFISSMGNSKKKELGQFVYNSLYDNKPSPYEKECKKIFLKNFLKTKTIKIYNKKPQIIFDKQNILTIYKGLVNKKIKFLNKISWINLPYIKTFNLSDIKVYPKKIVKPFFGTSLHKRAEFGNVFNNLEVYSNYIFINGKNTIKGIANFSKKIDENYLVNEITPIFDLNNTKIDFDFRKDKMFILHTNVGNSIILSNNAFDYNQIKQISMEGKINDFDYSRTKIFKLDEQHDINKAIKYDKTTVKDDDYNFILDTDNQDTQFKISFAIHNDTNSEAVIDNNQDTQFKISFAIHNDTNSEAVIDNNQDTQFKMVLRKHENES